MCNTILKTIFDFYSYIIGNWVLCILFISLSQMYKVWSHLPERKNASAISGDLCFGFFYFDPGGAGEHFCAVLATTGNAYGIALSVQAPEQTRLDHTVFKTLASHGIKLTIDKKSAPEKRYQESPAVTSSKYDLPAKMDKTNRLPKLSLPPKPTNFKRMQSEVVQKGVFLEPSKVVEALSRFSNVNPQLIQELISRSEAEGVDGGLQRYAMFPLAQNTVCATSGKILTLKSPIDPIKQKPVPGPIFTGHIETDMDSVGGSIAAAELYGGWVCTWTCVTTTQAYLVYLIFSAGLHFSETLISRFVFVVLSDMRLDRPTLTPKRNGRSSIGVNGVGILTAFLPPICMQTSAVHESTPRLCRLTAILCCVVKATRIPRRARNSHRSSQALSTVANLCVWSTITRQHRFNNNYMYVCVYIIDLRSWL